MHSYYDRELVYQLHMLTQSDMTIEQYRQRMESIMLRAGIKEESRLTIARFQSGLNYEIRDKVKNLPYNDLNDLV